MAEQTKKEHKRMEAVPYSGRLVPLLQKHLRIYQHLASFPPHGAVMPQLLSEYLPQYDAFQSRPTDLWVMTFPKCGTTWSQELAWVVTHGLTHPDITTPITARAPFFEWDCLFPAEFSLKDLPAGDLNKTGVMWDILVKAQGPRVIKSHLPLCLLPPSLTEQRSKVLYVSRDPRDVCISLFHHSVKLDDYTGTFDQFVDIFLEDIYPWGPFWLNVLQFWERRNDPNVLFITFEDLKKNLRTNIEKVAKFLEVKREGLPPGQLSAKELGELEKHLSFSEMSKNPATNNENLFKTATVSASENYESVTFMRKGQVGEHKKILTAEQHKRFEQWTKKWLDNSDFPFYRDYA